MSTRYYYITMIGIGIVVLDQLTNFKSVFIGRDIFGSRRIIAII